MRLCHPVRQAVVHLVVEVWREEGLRTDCSAGDVVESCMTCMLKKGSWCVPLSKA